MLVCCSDIYQQVEAKNKQCFPASFHLPFLPWSSKPLVKTETLLKLVSWVSQDRKHLRYILQGHDVMGPCASLIQACVETFDFHAQ